MNHKAPSTYKITVHPGNAPQRVQDLYHLGNVLRLLGHFDMAEQFNRFPREIEERIRTKWRDPQGRIIERFEVTLELESLGAVVEFAVTLRPIRRLAA